MGGWGVREGSLASGVGSRVYVVRLAGQGPAPATGAAETRGLGRGGGGEGREGGGKGGFPKLYLLIQSTDYRGPT